MLKKLFLSLRSRLNVLKGLFNFLWANKLWWILPFFIVFAVFGALILISQSSAALPFIYTLF
ncbi:MAG TPA: DUF5989 family protein [Candidatus Omnitrophota bacterium]|nr:DUF5989 family protein [Candidatus Omnitrophota bacterium]